MELYKKVKIKSKTNFKLNQLKLDLKRVSTFNFGNKEKYEELEIYLEPVPKKNKTKRYYFKEVGSHINKNKWKYINTLGKVAILGLIRQQWNKGKRKREREERAEDKKLLREIHASITNLKK